MSGSAFFDSNVLIYAFGYDATRSDIANELMSKGGVISVQVLNEFVAVSQRKIGKDWPEINSRLVVIRALCTKCSPLTIETHESALKIAARYQYLIYDALMIASALEAGCKTLYSEDLQHGQQIQGLTIRNPFR